MTGEGPEPPRQQRPQQRRRPGGPPRQRRRGPQPPRRGRGGGGGFDGQNVGLIFQRGLADFAELVRNFFSARPERAFRTILSFPAWLTLLLLNLLLFGVKQVLDAKAYIVSNETAGFEFKGWSTFGIGLFTQAIHLVVLFALIYAFAQLLQSEYRPPVVFVNLLAQASFPYVLLLIVWIPLSLLLPGFMRHLSMLPMIFFYLTLFLGFRELDNSKRSSPYWLFLVLILVSQLVLSYLPTVF